MGTDKLKPPPEFISAPKEQQIDFVQDLWDQIALDSEKVPIPDGHKRVLRERLEALRSRSDTGRLWDQVREELLDKIGKD